ncbi:MAG: hypothetical protein K2K67_10945 [Treponemataceae bacterium]|nr:hypothetical protein [Treponemataceae bacterium]
MSKALILMGIKHCGKTTQGRLLSKHFACPFFDTDDIIQAQTGLPPRSIYAEQGEAAFLAAERSACEHLARLIAERTPAAKPHAAVIATGGGICKNSAAVAVLRTLGTLIFLDAPESTAADRIVREAVVAADGTISNLPAYIAKERPQTLDDVRAIFHRFYEERTKSYADLCAVRVPMTPATPEENMQAVLRVLAVRR